MTKPTLSKTSTEEEGGGGHLKVLDRGGGEVQPEGQETSP